MINSVWELYTTSAFVKLDILDGLGFEKPAAGQSCEGLRVSIYFDQKNARAYNESLRWVLKDGHCMLFLLPRKLAPRQSKSRYDSISCYIHPSSQSHNDIPCETDEELKAGNTKAWSWSCSEQYGIEHMGYNQVIVMLVKILLT